MFWNKYPYTDFHELNLDYVLNAIKIMQNEIENFVNFNSIKYADPIEWNITSQYSKNTIVVDGPGYIAYMSVQNVPAGVQISNEEYWMKLFDLSYFMQKQGDLDELKTQIKDTLVNAINEIYDKIDYFVTPEMFGAKADGITDDTAAIQEAINTGKRVIFSGKTYACGEIFVHNAELDCKGSSFIMLDDMLFNCDANEIMQTAITAAYTAGDHNIEIAGDFDIGDVIVVRGTDIVNTDDQDAYSGGIAIIQNVSTDYSLSNTFDYDFPIGTSVTVYKHNTVNIRNIEQITPKDLNQMWFIHAAFNVDSIIENVRSTYEGWGGLAISGINCQITNSIINNQYDRNAYNYTLAISSPSVNCTVKNCIIDACWHCISIVGQYPVTNTVIEGNVLNMYTSQLSYREHANGKNTLFINNVATGLYFAHDAMIINNKLYKRLTDTSVTISLIGYDAKYLIDQNEIIGSDTLEVKLYGDETGRIIVDLYRNKIDHATITGTNFKGHVLRFTNDRGTGFYGIDNCFIDLLKIHDCQLGNTNLTNPNIITLIIENVIITKTNSQYGCRFVVGKTIINNLKVEAAAGITKDCYLTGDESIIDNLDIDTGTLITRNIVRLQNSILGAVSILSGYIIGKNNIVGSLITDYCSDGTSTYRANVTGGSYVLTAIN